MNAGRILGRALVVLGGAAAACAIAWLTATASASTVTEVTDAPIAVVQPPALDSIPVVRQARGAAAPAVARVRELSGAAAHTARFATGVVASVPATVVSVGRTAVAEPGAPAAGPRDHLEKPAAGPGVAEASGSTRATASSGPRERSAAFSSVVPVRAGVVSQPHTRSEHGDGGRSWLLSCVGPAVAGFTAGHDRNFGDAIQESAAVRPQPSHHGYGVLRRAVASAEIQPGVTPD
ncbi:hypothetical protein [Amycolatopsis kentuckyensis]|uniref:hypothetical protein n=1 Tax=Amycolatopsis kentuckyensis TaxID=218823 RepID=UPI003567CA2A